MPNERELLEILLTNRGIKKEDWEKFLNPSYDRDIYDPFLMLDMERVCVRIFEAIEHKEKIVIYSDYDCDGIPASVIINDFFNKIGYKNFSIYIPDRHDEGYGLHMDAIENFINDKVDLLITFDLGITAIEEVANAETNGINVIITDHHLPQDEIPKAYAILNPKRVGCNYPDKNLCGAGIAFKLVQAMVKKYGEYFKIHSGWDKWLLDMASVATLADQVPLLDENRTLAYFGLKVLKKGRRFGLRELFYRSGVDISQINEEDITFTLAPKINAASRMDDPMNAFLLLSTTNDIEARKLADHLIKINNERKIIVAHIMKDVKKILSKKLIEDQDNPIVVIGNPSWRIGVLGIVAAKITEEYKKPAFVWGSDGSGFIRGSCRAFGDINLVDLMSELPKGALLEFGGHKGAGGFSTSNEEIHFLESRLLEVFKYNVASGFSVDINVDATITIDDVNHDNYKIIEKMSPFGMANPKPIFLFKDLIISNIKEFGKEKNHLEIVFKNSRGRDIKAISFFKTRESYNRSLSVGDAIDMTASIEKNNFLGKEEIRLRIFDIIK